MKYIKTINEMVKNHKLVNYYINSIFNRLKKIQELVNHIKIEKNENKHYIFDIYTIEELKKDLIDKILKNFKVKLLYSGYIFTYKLFDSVIRGVIKSSKIIRVKPNKYVYHYSHKKNRNEILKNGLIPQKFSNSERWGNTLTLEYEDSIFAINNENISWITDENTDRWIIDTTQLKNKWWIDLNLNSKSYIMTFEPIPIEFLKLTLS